MVKPKISEIQNPNRAYVNATKTMEEASLRLPGDTTNFLKLCHNKKCWPSKNGCTRLVKTKSETSIKTYKTWRLKVKMCECYICLWLLGNKALHDISKLWKIAWCARTKFKQSQVSSFNKCKNYLLIQSSGSAVLKIPTA